MFLPPHSQFLLLFVFLKYLLCLPWRSAAADQRIQVPAKQLDVADVKRYPRKQKHCRNGFLFSFKDEYEAKLIQTDLEASDCPIE